MRARTFFEAAFCVHQIVALHAAALGLQRVLHLTFRGVAMIFFAKSILTSRFSHFPHPLLTRLLSHQYGEVQYTNEWTGNLSVILFVAFLLRELNGKA